MEMKKDTMARRALLPQLPKVGHVMNDLTSLPRQLNFKADA